MNKLKIAASAIYVTAVGTLLHFVYDLTGGSVLVAWFSGVNESTFEHMKLFFWAEITLFVIEFVIMKRKKGITENGFFSSRLQGMLLGMAFIVVFFYTYQGIIGRNIGFLNIIDFVLGAFLSEVWIETRRHTRKSFDELSLAAFGAIAILFLVFTFAPPHIGLFLDPVNGVYGINK